MLYGLTKRHSGWASNLNGTSVNSYTGRKNVPAVDLFVQCPAQHVRASGLAGCETMTKITQTVK
jgi:hypothetical protein